MVVKNGTEREAFRKEREKPTVVCVDDEPLVSRSLYRLLSREPYDVLIADTPRQALKYVRDFDIDLVITDQRMPQMSGVELIREVRQLSPATSGIILTAYPESVLVDDPPDQPSPPLYAKPWDDETLCAGIREMLLSHGTAEVRRENPGGRSAMEAAPHPGRPKAAPRERSARELATRTVLVPVDGKIEPELTLGSVLPLLSLDPFRIQLLRILPDLGLHRDAYAYLEKVRARLAQEGYDAAADVRWGDPAQQILLHARHADADLIVLSAERRRPPFRLFHRSLVERLIDESDVPLLVGRPEWSQRFWKRILVPLDGSREAESVLPEAVRLAGLAGARIELVGVSPRELPGAYGYAPIAPRSFDRRPYLEEVARTLDFEEVTADAVFYEGYPASEIVRHARRFGTDLIVMGAWKRRAWARLLPGGVARRVVQEAPCPVLVRRLVDTKEI